MNTGGVESIAPETFLSGAMHQQGHGEEFIHAVERVERVTLVNYSERKEYLDRRAAEVALEVFGDDFSRTGMSFTEAARDVDVPYMSSAKGMGTSLRTICFTVVSLPLVI